MTFPLDANAAAPGWYHAPGDPDGTVRYWNGTDWIGFPTRDPAAMTAPIGTSPRRVRYTKRTAVLSGLCIVALTVLAGVFAALALRIGRDVGELDALLTVELGDTERATQSVESSEPPALGVRDLGIYIENLWRFALAALGAITATGIVFLTWTRSTANAVNLNDYRRHHVPAPKTKSFVDLVLTPGFLVVWLLIAPLLIIRGAIRALTGKFEGGLFSIVSDTAAAASDDPHQDHSSISPIKLIVWWALWWGPITFMLGTWLSVWVWSPISASSMQTVLSLTAIMIGLNVISVLCILLTVIQTASRLAKQA